MARRKEVWVLVGGKATQTLRVLDSHPENGRKLQMMPEASSDLMFHAFAHPVKPCLIEI